MKKDKAYELHLLIQSLTASEKKYVRWQLSKYDTSRQSKELLLFDVMNQPKLPEEELIINAYQAQNYESSYLAADRNQLYEEILDALVRLAAPSSGELQTTLGLQKAMVLFDKKNFAQALKQLKRTKKHATQQEHWGSLISLLQLEQRCLKVLGDFEGVTAAMQAQQETYERILLQNQFEALHYESIQLRISYAKARSLEQIEAIETLKTKVDDLTAKYISQSSFYAAFHRLETLCNYYFVKDDSENESKSNEELVLLMQAHPWYLQNNPLNYVAIQTRLLTIQRRLSPTLFWVKLPEYRSLAKGLQKQKQEAESTIFIFSHNYELDQYINEKRWAAAVEMIPRMEQGLKKYKTRIDIHLHFSAHYRFALAYFFSQHYEEALNATIFLLDEFPETLRPDVYQTSLLLQIIIHYELGHYKLIPSLVTNTRYHIKKTNRLFKTESLILSALQKLSKAKLPEEAAKKIFNTLENKLLKLQSDPFERKVLGIFNFLDWISTRHKHLSE